MAILKSDLGEISYTLVRRKGMKNMRVKITDNGSVCVSANASVPVAVIERFLLEKSAWIIKNSRQAAEKSPAELFELKNGVEIRVCGRIYAVNIQNGADYVSEDVMDVTATANKERNKLNIFSAQPENDAHNERLLLGFVAAKGREILSGYYDYFFEKSGYTGKKPALTLKMLKSKWGHCDRRKNEIMLNFALCTLDERFMAYVAAHEVAHLLVPNHSAEFYRTGEMLLPRFRQTDREMRGISTDLRRNMTVDGQR